MSGRLRPADRRLPITMDHITRTGRRRSRRDWVVDIVMFVLAVLFGLFAASQRIAAPVQPPWLFEVDQVVGALGCAALWLRRRWPTQLAVVLVAASAFSEMVAGAMLAALFTVAVHRSKRVSWAVFLFSLLAARGLHGAAARSAAPTGTDTAGGRCDAECRVRLGAGDPAPAPARHQSSDRGRAARRAGAAAAREAIAREMHDVLAHRLSLLSVHAGALEYRPDAPPEDVARAAGVIRDSAHQALQDLREVIGVLRAPGRGAGRSRTAGGPARRWSTSPARARRCRCGRCASDVDRRRCRPLSAARRTGSCRRRLTNARKHAPGAAGAGDGARRAAGRA